MTKVDYVLTGCANGHPVRIEATGTVTRSGAKLRFRARGEPPLTFDAGLAHLAGIDAVASLAAGLVVAGDEPVVVRCRTDLLGEGGVEVGTIVAVAVIELQRGRVACKAQLVEARVAAEVGERVVSVGERIITATSVAGGVALSSAATVHTSRAREWIALSSTLAVEVDARTSRSVSIAAAMC